MPKVIEALQKGPDGTLWFNLNFLAGLHTSQSPLAIDLQECAEGENFLLGLDEDVFRPRPSFDLAATVPNASPVYGFIELIKTDGSVSLLVQAGTAVYQWDGESAFTSVGTVSGSARLRGNRRSTSALDDKVIITDLNKAETVKTWNGTTFENLAHNLGGNFYAKYCMMSVERALFGNVRTTTDTPHLLVASKRSDITNLTTANRPVSGLGDDDPWFLPMPDLRPINGMLTAFKQTLFSTEGPIGTIFQLTGTTAQDYALEQAFDGSGAEGDEAITPIGNDVIYGRAGKIESMYGVNTYGDIAADDVSRWISDKIKEVKSWQMAYNQRVGRAYLWGENGNEIWVFQQSLYVPAQRSLLTPPKDPYYNFGLSPWSKWTTAYGSKDFRNTAAALVRRPTDGLDVVYFGDDSGNIFLLEGVGEHDGGTADVTAYRTSAVIAGLTGSMYDVTGTIFYRRKSGATITLDFMWQGQEIADSSIVVTIPANTGGAYFGGSYYFGGAVYFGVPFAGRVLRQGPFKPSGRSSHLQVKASSSAPDFEIHLIRLGFREAPAQ